MILLLVSSCTKNNRQSVVGSNTNPVQPGGTPTPIGSSSTNATDPLGGSSCTGTATDGYDDLPQNLANNAPLIGYSMSLSGANVWLPGNPPFNPESPYYDQLSTTNKGSCNALTSASCAGNINSADKCTYCLNAQYSNSIMEVVPYIYPIVSKSNSWGIFKNDGALYVRLKIDDPTALSLQTYKGALCYGRKATTYNGRTGFVPYAVPFTKVKVDIYAHVLRKSCSTPTCNTENDFAYTGAQMLVMKDVEINVDGCSKVLRVRTEALAPGPQDSVVVSIRNVRNNALCLETGSADPNICPYAALNTGNCWSGTLQVATNQTEFFKGLVRSQIP
jgi:hypothetical protein